MNLSEKMLQALNKQIQVELESAYIYWAMAAYCEEKCLRGCSAWLEHHAKEELEHAQRIYRYINRRGCGVVFESLAAPKTDWDSVQIVFKKAYEHEQYVTSCINELVALARAENDAATEQMLQWFLEEQVEEEDITATASEQLALIGNSGQGLYLFDLQMATRAGSDNN